MSCSDKSKKRLCLSSFLWFGTSFTPYWFGPHFPCNKICLLINISYDILSTMTISSTSSFLLNDLQLFLSYTLLFLLKNQNQKQKFDQHSIEYWIFPVIQGMKTKMVMEFCADGHLYKMNTPRAPFSLKSSSVSLSHNWIANNCSSHISRSLWVDGLLPTASSLWVFPHDQLQLKARRLRRGDAEFRQQNWEEEGPYHSWHLNHTLFFNIEILSNVSWLGIPFHFKC